MKKLQNVSLQGLFFLCFWQYVYGIILVARNLPCPEKFMFACMHSGIITFAKRFILNVWQCFEYVSDSIAFLCLLSILNSSLMLCTASETFRILAYSKPCVFKHFQHYWGIVGLIQAYSSPCVTLAYSQPCHIPSHDIFRTRGIFKTLRNFD